MAEIAQRNSEEILPQFEEIIQLKLFTPGEMKEIIQKHIEHEYKLVRREKDVKDFHEYINYKKNFLKLARIRMRLRNVNKRDRRKVERMFVRHTSKLYDMTVRHFSADVSLWQDYIEFMIKEKEFAKVVIIYDSLLTFHMGEAELFINSARFLMKYVKDVDLARKTLFKGIRLHKNDPRLYQEIFKIELDFAARKRRESADDEEKLNSDPVLRGKTAEVVFTSALKVINDMNFKFSLLEISSKYKFAKTLQKKIYKSIKNDHKHEPEMWKKIALLEIDGINFEPIDMACTKSKDVFHQRVRRCYHVFSKAVKEVPTGMMWFYFIDTFFGLLKSYPEKHEFLNKFLTKLVQRSDVQNLLREEHYLCWIESTEKCVTLENLIDFIESAIQAFPQSAKLWLKKLQYHLGQHDPEKFKEIFTEAHKCLKDERSQYMMWQFMLQSCVDLSVSEINTFFENLIRESPVTYPTLRPLYLDWIISKNNLSMARSVFASVSQIPPYNIELFRKMIAMELSQKTPDVKIIRQLYDMACLYFGSTYSDLWLDYVEFEKLYGNPMNVTNIYWSAVKQLEPCVSDKFITEYSLLKTA